MWSERVSEPFRSDRSFWWSLTASAGAFVSLVAASVVYGVVGGAGVTAYAVPVVLLAAAAWLARSSSAGTRPHFASREEWRDAERRAVATVLLRRAVTGGSGPS